MGVPYGPLMAQSGINPRPKAMPHEAAMLRPLPAIATIVPGMFYIVSASANDGKGLRRKGSRPQGQPLKKTCAPGRTKITCRIGGLPPPSCTNGSSTKARGRNGDHIGITRDLEYPSLAGDSVGTQLIRHKPPGQACRTSTALVSPNARQPHAETQECIGNLP